jgi:hypothetical protein
LAVTTISILPKLYFSCFGRNNYFRFTLAVFQFFWPQFNAICILALLAVTTVSDIHIFPAVSAVQYELPSSALAVSLSISFNKLLSC